ncbi:MAG TPA: CheR family methyltransferase [Candidatus Limnocylindrales bacterium]|nr:CheR family methyltransferase [Candidatus Limnocylindrales bacterium]
MAATDEPIAQLVVIGSSAGGIDALSTIVRTLPADMPVPVLVAQHLNPNRPSHLPEILQRVTKLTVEAVEGSEPVRLDPATVYVLPAGSGAEITDHAIRLVDRETRGPNPSVDHLFSSAAQAFGEGLIAVILTGTGSDGAVGARDVKLVGGTVIVQNPETASYPGMPNALAPTSIDIVAELEAIGPLLHDLVTGAYTPSKPDDERVLRSFLDQLRERSGIDFNGYKRATILRRLQRRMAATGTTKLREYVRFVQAHPDEYERLTSSFLIKVTQFFRDRDLFQHLREIIVPQLIEDARGRERELRIWSAGCATGEEAYSLAMLIADALGDETAQFNVRIFATDVDGDAISFARRGIYPAAAVAELPGDLVERHFVRAGDGYEVRKRIRSMTVFGQHDLGQRAPFPRVDLALCRNVLIYFTAELQKRALQLFAFSLRDGGYLVLGKAESTTPLPDYFVLSQQRLKVYRRQGDRVLIPPTRIRDSAPVPQSRATPPRRSSWAEASLARNRDSARLATPAEKADGLLLRLPVGVVVVDRRYDIQSINAAARRMFGIHSPAIGEDVVHLVPAPVAASIRTAIDDAIRGGIGGAIVEIRMTLPEGSEQRAIQVATHPMHAHGDTGPIEGVVITASDVTAAITAQRDLENAIAAGDRDREELSERTREMAQSHADLLEANQELTTANAELRSANEELLVANEEVQAATEEVETLNEELQATNEELETLNEELQASVEELNTANEDLQVRTQEVQSQSATLLEERSRLASILASMGDGVLAVDRSGQRVMANAAFERMFPKIDDFQPEDDDGGPLPRSEQPGYRAARGEAFASSFTITEPDGRRRWFEATAQPLEGEDGHWGGVLVIRDISDRSLRRLQERFMAAASHELRTPLAALQGFVQLAQRRLATGNVDDGARYIAEALVQTRSLVSLVGRLFDVAAIESGRLTLDKRPIDLVPVVRQAVDVAGVLQDGVRIEAEIDAEELPVLADRTRIEQVLFNLISNAFTHAAQGGVVVVRATKQDGSARIDVEDRGPGIAQERLQRLFERFGESEQPSPSGGLGLGLFISREIVRGHGGSVEAHSTEGVGTTITVTLPLRRQGSTSRRRGSGPRAARGPKRPTT